MTIHDVEFENFLYDQLIVTGTGKEHWIGLRAVCPTCPFTWADAKPFGRLLKLIQKLSFEK